MTPRRLKARAERGVTMLVVLILLTIMLLGGMALARMVEVGTLSAGNVAYREAALQASEVGVNTAFAAVNALTDETSASGAWYTPAEIAKDGNGLPSVDWTSASIPKITVGTMTVQYVAERACTVANVTYPLRQCLVKQIPQPESRKAGAEQQDPPNSKQFRITVRVTNERGTETYVQALVTREKS